jgi:hypothetical protein
MKSLMQKVLWFRYEDSRKRLLCSRVGHQLVVLLRGDWIKKVLTSSMGYEEVGPS